MDYRGKYIMQIYDNWKKISQKLELASSKNDLRLQFYSYKETLAYNRSKETKLDILIYTATTHQLFIELFSKQGLETALDLETTGLDPLKHDIYSVAITLEDNLQRLISYFILWEQLQPLKELFIKFLHSNIIICHSAGFELKFLSQVEIPIEPIDIRDSQISSYLAYPGRKTGLKLLAAEILDFHYDSFEVMLRGRDIRSVPISELSVYNCSDALASYQLEKHFSLFRSVKEDRLYHLELKVCKLIARMELLGINVDKELLLEIKVQNDILLNNIQSQVKGICQIDSLKSVKQLRKALFEDLKISNLGVKKTPTRLESTDDETLLMLLDRLSENKESHNYKFIDLLIQHRKLSKIQSTYVVGLLEKITERNRIHTSFNQTVTTTGRLSSSKPNLQNVPPKSRKAFIASSGKKLVAIDYSQVEVRILAHFSKEPTLINAFSEGLDPHLEVAKSLLKKQDISSEERRVCKTLNFGVIYGMEAKKLSAETGFSIIESNQFLAEYWKQFPFIADYMRSVYYSVIENGYTTTILGRKRFYEFYNKTLINELKQNLLKCDSFDDKARLFSRYIGRFSEYEAKILREAGNAPIQGSSADITKLAMVACDKAIKEYGFNADLLLQIHDELVWEVNKREVSDFIEVMETVMVSVISLDVPLKVDSHYADSWSEAK